MDRCLLLLGWTEGSTGSAEGTEKHSKADGKTLKDSFFIHVLLSMPSIPFTWIAASPVLPGEFLIVLLMQLSNSMKAFLTQLIVSTTPDRTNSFLLCPKHQDQVNMTTALAILSLFIWIPFSHPHFKIFRVKIKDYPSSPSRGTQYECISEEPRAKMTPHPSIS